MLDLGTVTVGADVTVANFTMTGGTLATAPGGTLDFSGGVFQWAGGAISGAGGGAFINDETMNLTGSADLLFDNDGTLDDYGSIVQTGAGDLALHSDNVSPTVLNIEPGGSYLLGADSGVSNDFGGETQINNAGLIEKTAGTGTSTILVNGALNNTGTIEAESGTISLVATLAQVSSGTLTGGTSGASGDSTLDLPSGTSITSNQASISLAGAGASITGISGLAANSGSLSLSGGADVSTTGNLSNTGSLTIVAGSTLSVAGNFTQGSSGSITIGLGGASVGNEYGQLAITGTAALAGSVNATPASGFLPAAGVSFPIIAYASQTGGSSLSFAGVNSGALAVLEPHIGTTGITLSTVTAPSNLVAQPFTVAANAVVGQGLAVTYQVDNESVNSASGTWTDSVYFSTQPTLNSSSVLLGRRSRPASRPTASTHRR